MHLKIEKSVFSEDNKPSSNESNIPGHRDRTEEREREKAKGCIDK